MILWSFAHAAVAVPDLFTAAAQSGAGGASLRPYTHVFLAYAAAWILILFWVWRISRRLKRLGSSTVEGAERAVEDG